MTAKIIARKLLSYLDLLFVVSVIVIITTQCKSVSEKGNEMPEPLYPSPQVVALNADSGYHTNPVSGDSIQPLKNSNGDTIQTGIPILAIPSLIDPSSVKMLEFARIKKDRIILSGQIDTISLENMPRVFVDESKLKHFIPGRDTSSYILLDASGDTIPTGIPLTISGKTVPVRYVKPVETLPLSPSKVSIFSLHYMDAYHGFKSSRISAILEDRRGCLWIAGTEGLSCYDGKRIFNFTVKEGLMRNLINYLFEDKEGNIWIDYGLGEISRYDGKNFTQFSFKSGRNFNLPGSNEILEDNKGNIWFKGLLAGVTRYDGKTFTHITSKEGLSNNNIRTIYEDSKGNLWFGTDGSGMCRYDGNLFTYFTMDDGLINNTVSAIHEDKKGNLWFGTDSGVTRYDGKYFINFTEENGLSGNFTSSIIEDRQGNLWFGTYDKGITRFDGRSFLSATEKEGLISNNINKIGKDHYGNLWFCTGRGLIRYNANNYTRFSGNPGPFNFRISCMIEDRRNNYWFGTSNEGIVFFDGKKFRQFFDKDGLGSNYISALKEDRNGILWIGTLLGLVKFDGNHFTQITGLGNLSNYNMVRSIFEDSKGNLWFGSSNGVIIYDGKKYTQFSEKDGLFRKPVFSLIEDKKGNIWIGTLGGGVSKYNGKTLTNFTTKEGLSDNIVSDIYEDDQGNIWFSTSEGVCFFDGNRFVYLNERVGLLTKFASSVFDDKYGNVWALTSKGLHLIPKNISIIGIPQRKLNSVREPEGIVSYGEREGLNSYIKVCRDSKNKLWLINGYEPGVTILDLKNYSNMEKAPMVLMNSISINGQFLDFGGTDIQPSMNLSFSSIVNFSNYPLNLKLPYNLSHLTFNFHANSQVSDDRVMYSYKIDELGNSWSLPSEDARAEYNYIPPGTYTFKVRAMGKSQEWGDPFEYKFTIKHPWWFSWWAYIFYAIIFVAGLLGIFRWRTSAIQKENSRLEKSVEVRTKELKAAKIEAEKSFAELKVTQKQLIQSEKMASLGELTAGIAHEIQNPLNFVNNFSELSGELIEELTEKIENGEKEEIKDITEDIRQNLQKINHHGKRADAIVKGMLQHSRLSTGQKEPTDINALVDEYLRLSFHGIRAKDKSFTANIETSLDNSIGKVSVIPQDIGRVLLNLIGNAFYTVTEKKRETQDKYDPTVSIRTIKQHGNVEICVKDNGMGIPEKVKDKIFQPFFTTKPTGQGTGLGLSLSYDIINAHGGELKVETKEGEGSEFIIILPVAENEPQSIKI